MIKRTVSLKKMNIRDTIEIDGMQCMVTAVKLVRDGHDCNKDICMRCAYPDPDEYHIEAEPLMGEERRVELEKAEAEKAEAEFQAAHELYEREVVGSRAVTRAYRDRYGKGEIEDGATIEFSGFTFKRHAYMFDGKLSGRWNVDAEASGLIEHKGKYYRVKA